MTRAGVNNLIWAVSLLLQLVLLLCVFRRGLARQLPWFTTLLLFYPLRTAGLFLSYGHVAPTTYVEVYNVFSVIDLFLQFAVVVEIARKYTAARGGWTASSLSALTGVLAGSAVATFAVVQILPANAAIPPDRAQIFDSFLMILLCLWMMVRPAARLLRQVSFGLAFFGGWSVLAMAERTFAALHRDAHAFTAWSYVSSGAYVAVVIYWLVALRDGAGTRSQASIR